MLQEKIHEMKDHTERLKKYCHLLSAALGLSAKDGRELCLLAEMHDIGKVGVSAQVLNKDGPFTPEEDEEIREHCVVGYRIALNNPELAPIAEYILCHHEQWDGKGYPRGLSGEEIPLVVRIFAVANFYDTLRYNQGYHKAMEKDSALDTLKRSAGSKLDPSIVSLFLKILPEIEKHTAPGSRV